MTRTSIFRPLALSAVILTAGLVVPAQAQPAPKAPAEGRMARHDPAEMAARRTDHLRAALQLTPAQEPALQAYVASMKPPGDMRQKMGERRQEMAGLTTPERLDRMNAMMAEHQAAFETRAAAIRKFYAQLTPTQQKAFDALGPMHGHGGMGHKKDGRGMGMGPRGGAR